MRLESWHVILLMAMMFFAIAVVIAVTLIVLWTVGMVRKRNRGDQRIPPN
jgi:heme/copper-type cytochrome/quinol oxidase subunit 2